MIRHYNVACQYQCEKARIPAHGRVAGRTRIDRVRPCRRKLPRIQQASSVALGSTGSKSSRAGLGYGRWCIQKIPYGKVGIATSGGGNPRHGRVKSSEQARQAGQGGPTRGLQGQHPKPVENQAAELPSDADDRPLESVGRLGSCAECFPAQRASGGRLLVCPSNGRGAVAAFFAKPVARAADRAGRGCCGPVSWVAAPTAAAARSPRLWRRCGEGSWRSTTAHASAARSINYGCCG